MVSTDDVIQDMRRRALKGEISEREMALFYEFVEEALADALVNVAAPYRLGEDVTQAAAMVLRHKGEGIH